MRSLQFISPFDAKRVLHFAQLADTVALFRPLYALGYLATLQKEFGLPAAHPLPHVEQGTLTLQQQLDEVRQGMEDARAGRKPVITGKPVTANADNVREAA